MQRIVMTPCDIVNGCAVMIRRNVFESIGLIDERFFLICEESDFCLRALEAGFRCGVIGETLVWHKHSVSFAKSGKPLQRYYGARNLGLLLQKHPGGQGRKSVLRGSLAYLRHLYHLFSHEQERGNATGARAICDGLTDHLLRRYGVRHESRGVSRCLGGTIFHIARTMHWLRSLSVSPGKSSSSENSFL